MRLRARGKPGEVYAHHRPGPLLQGGRRLVNKVLAIEEEGGAESADYSIRNLQSSQTLTIAATRTDPATGKLRTDTYRVKGPVSIMLTTTNPQALHDETRNRFLVVTVDESHEQTARILKAQREEDTLWEAFCARPSGKSS